MLPLIRIKSYVFGGFFLKIVIKINLTTWGKLRPSFIRPWIRHYDTVYILSCKSPSKSCRNHTRYVGSNVRIPGGHGCLLCVCIHVAEPNGRLISMGFTAGWERTK